MPKIRGLLEKDFKNFSHHLSSVTFIKPPTLLSWTKSSRKIASFKDISLIIFSTRYSKNPPIKWHEE